jgi:hypothetical protein
MYNKVLCSIIALAKIILVLDIDKVFFFFCEINILNIYLNLYSYAFSRNV